MTTFGDSTASDWDAAQSESGVHHEQPANTDWAAADIVELGLPTHDAGGTALEAYWPFDEDSGTTAYDVSGNARDGSLNGVSVGQPGIRGTTGYLSDGVDDYVSTTWSGIGGSTNRTFEAWIKTSTGADQSLITYGDQLTNGAKWLVRIDEASTAGNWVVRVEVAGGFLRGTTHVADGAWHHVACVLNGTDVIDHTLYVDGVAETVDGSSAQAVNTDTTADDVWLLRRPSTWDGSGGRVLDGLIDEPRMYSRALSASEIQTHAHGDTPTGTLTSAVKSVADIAPPEKLTTTTTLGGGSIDVTVNEDTDQDGIAENTQTVTLAGGTDEVNSLSGFAGGTNVDYWVDIDQSVSSPTATSPTLDSYTVADKTVATAAGQSAGVSGPGATTTTTRTSSATGQSAAASGAGGDGVTTRTALSTGQAVALPRDGATTATTRVATATTQSLGATGPGASTTTTRVATATTQSLAATGPGASTTTARTAVATTQSLAGASGGASTITARTAPASGASLAASGDGALGADVAVAAGQSLAAGGVGAGLRTSQTAPARGQRLAGTGPGARGVPDYLTLAKPSGQVLAASGGGVTATTARAAPAVGQVLAAGVPITRFGDGIFGDGPYGGNAASVTASRTSTAAGASLSVFGRIGGRIGISKPPGQTLAASGAGATATAATTAHPSGQAEALSGGGGTLVSSRIALAPGQFLSESGGGAGSTTSRVASTPGQALAEFGDGARTPNISDRVAPVSKPITATVAFEAATIAATTAFEADPITATVAFESAPVNATVAFEADPVTATVVWSSEAIISQIHLE